MSSQRDNFIVPKSLSGSVRSGSVVGNKRMALPVPRMPPLKSSRLGPLTSSNGGGQTAVATPSLSKPTVNAIHLDGSLDELSTVKTQIDAQQADSARNGVLSEISENLAGVSNGNLVKNTSSQATPRFAVCWIARWH
jgi:hypothetical protein